MATVMTEDAADIELCLRGEKLYGDDFGAEKLAAWYADEAHGYHDLGAGDRRNYRYGYHALNTGLGYRHLPARRFERVLGLGSAYGDEMLPVIDRVGRITILEPAEAFTVDRIRNVPVNYVSPQPGGDLPFASASFDLITCFGVLHHIPNVSTVLREMRRVLRPNGFALIREPIVSMGDWRRPRPGLTRRERGIPKEIFQEIVTDAGFATVRATPCMHPLVRRMGAFLKNPLFNQRWAVELDRLFCALPLFGYRYHPTSAVQKLQPGCLYLVLRAA